MTEWKIKGRRPKFPDEAWVKKQVKAMFEELKEQGFGVWFFMPQGTTVGRVGIPDFVGCIEGVTVGIETKKAGGEISKLQEKEIGNLLFARGRAYVVDENGLSTLWNKLQKTTTVLCLPDELEFDLRGADDKTTDN